MEMNYNRGDYTPPKAEQRWKEGSPCCLCSQPLQKKHLSQNQIEREKELKWGYHYACFNKTVGAMDRSAK